MIFYSKYYLYDYCLCIHILPLVYSTILFFTSYCSNNSFIHSLFNFYNFYNYYIEDALKRDDLTTAQREQLKGAKYVALYKAQYVLNHTKGQMGLVLDDQEREYVRVSGVEAATLYPDSDNSRLQDFESAMMEDDVDKAIMLVDEGIKDAHTAGDAALECAYSLYKANALTNKVLLLPHNNCDMIILMIIDIQLKPSIYI